MKKLVAAMLTAVLCMSVLTACGSSEAETAETAAETTVETAETEVAEATETEDAAASDALADGVLNVGTNAEFPPFEYVNDNVKERTALIIDEFPYIPEENPTVKSLLQHAIDHSWKNNFASGIFQNQQLHLFSCQRKK